MLSPIHPTVDAIAPIKNTYIMYLMVVASESNVHLAFTKNENVTATQNAPKLASAWLVWKILYATRNTIQCMAVLRIPTEK